MRLGGVQTNHANLGVNQIWNGNSVNDIQWISI